MGSLFLIQQRIQKRSLVELTNRCSEVKSGVAGDVFSVRLSVHSCYCGLNFALTVQLELELQQFITAASIIHSSLVLPRPQNPTKSPKHSSTHFIDIIQRFPIFQSKLHRQSRQQRTIETDTPSTKPSPATTARTKAPEAVTPSTVIHYSIIYTRAPPDCYRPSSDVVSTSPPESSLFLDVADYPSSFSRGPLSSLFIVRPSNHSRAT